MRGGCLIAIILTTSALGGLFLLDAADPPGWKCSQTSGCVPDGGRWEGLKIGMTHAEALKTACTMTNRGIISTDEQWHRQWIKIAPFVDSPVETVNGSCRAKPSYADSTAPIWAVQARHLRCALFLEKRVAFVEFDDNNKLTRISLHCPFLYI